MRIYTVGMFVEASVDFSQQTLLHQVSTQVLAMSIRDARATADQFQQLIDTAESAVQTVRDGSLGQAVNLFA